MLFDEVLIVRFSFLILIPLDLGLLRQPLFGEAPLAPRGKGGGAAEDTGCAGFLTYECGG